MDERRELLESFAEHLTSPNMSRASVEKVAGGLIDRYGDEPWRHYHIVQHLRHMGGFLLDNIDDLRNPRVAFWSTLVHDSIYVPPAPKGVNERLSAELGVVLLTNNLPTSEVKAIEEYTLATVDHQGDLFDTDKAHFLDADMIIIGEAEEVFEDYDDKIGLEFLPYYDLGSFRVGREHVMRTIYYQNPLYLTEAAQSKYGPQSIVNLERKLTQLEQLNAN